MKCFPSGKWTGSVKTRAFLGEWRATRWAVKGPWGKAGLRRPLLPAVGLTSEDDNQVWAGSSSPRASQSSRAGRVRWGGSSPPAAQRRRGLAFGARSPALTGHPDALRSPMSLLCILGIFHGCLLQGAFRGSPWDEDLTFLFIAHSLVCTPFRSTCVPSPPSQSRPEAGLSALSLTVLSAPWRWALLPSPRYRREPGPWQDERTCSQPHPRRWQSGV